MCVFNFICSYSLALYAVRAVIFAVLWLALGKRMWFLPNILAEEATMSELFKFMPDSKDDDPPPKWSTRIAFGTVAGLIIWLVLVHGPNEAARARYLVCSNLAYLRTLLSHASMFIKI